ncbi:MAG: PAS domain S-box protein [Methanobacterium sp.]|nr:PAS domain S-box protein [Methanobacterium sp.]
MADVNILLVEDESIEALDIKHTLESFGYNVPYIASRGEEAVEKALEIMPDLVLIDIVLKGDFNGIKVASEIKKLNIPFIYLTAHSEEATVQEAKLTEPYGFIIKPYAPLELKYTIDIALEASLDPLVTIGPDGKITDVNQATEKVTGYSREKIIGTDFSNYFTEPDQARKGYQQVFTKGFVRDYPLKIQHKDKSITPVLYNASVYKDETGDIAGVFAAARDITERQKADETIHEIMENFRAIADNASEGILIAIGEGIHVYANQIAAEITGYSVEELLQTSIIDLAHPDEIKELMERYKTRIAGEALSPTHETLIVTKDEKVIPVELTGAITVWKGQTADMVIIRDITERKQVEKEQKRLNRNLKAISNCNQTLLRAIDETTLLKEICRIICDEAGYRLAWVGYAEHDKAKTIRPVAWAGFDSGYIANTKLSWSKDTARGQGPAGIVIRSGEIIYVQDFATDPLMTPWRESAIQHGYRSGIALPLKDEKRKVFGVLLIYSSKPNAITTDEILLMEELPVNLAFGITSLRERAERLVWILWLPLVRMARSPMLTRPRRRLQATPERKL